MYTVALRAAAHRSWSPLEAELFNSASFCYRPTPTLASLPRVGAVVQCRSAIQDLVRDDGPPPSSGDGILSAQPITWLGRSDAANVSVGSNSEVAGLERDVRSTPKSRHRQNAPAGPFRADSVENVARSLFTIQ